MDCILKLVSLVFDDISFKRLGMHSDNEPEFTFSIDIGTNMEDANIKRVSIKILGEKKEEYVFEIQVSGFFAFEGCAEDKIIQQNAVAIVMPYIRSEVSILTSQPGMEPIVLPPFNIIEMMKSNS